MEKLINTKNGNPYICRRGKLLVNLALNQTRNLSKDKESDIESNVSDDKDDNYVPSSQSSVSSFDSEKNTPSYSKHVSNSNYKINIISNIVIKEPSIPSTSGASSDQTYNFDTNYNNCTPDENVADYNNYIIEQIIETLVSDAMNLSDRKLYTKKGELRKRKKNDRSVTERSTIKKQKVMSKHKITGTCLNCKKKCNKKISIARRQDINSQFWNMTKQEQNTFLLNSVSKMAKKRNTVTGCTSRRTHTLTYSFKNSEGIRKDVCKIFFLKTLGYHEKNDKPLRTILNDSDNLLTPKKHRRGGSSRKFDRNVIIKHIQSFNPTVSHYRRSHAPNRLYLPSDITIKLMYDCFKEKYNITCSYSLYRQVVSELNISFANLGNEECFACERYDIHKTENSHDCNHDCADCTSYMAHRIKYIQARQKYKLDSEIAKTSSIYTADLQKVIMLPRCDTFKEVIFTPRLVVFNESFVHVGMHTKIPPVAVLWHEAISGRKKFDIVCTFYAFLKKIRDSENVTIWLDNCSGQNKNWCLYSFFVYIVNSDEVNLTNITLRYFEPGHTFMAADSFHHRVEQSLNRKAKVYDFLDFVDAVKKSTDKTEVIELAINDFFEWSDESSQYKLGKENPRPYLSNMVEVKFTRGLRTLEYKTSFEEPGIILNFLKAKCQKMGISKPARKLQPRGISAERKQTIIAKLGKIMPSTRLQFWENLPVNNEQQDMDIMLDDTD